MPQGDACRRWDSTLFTEPDDVIAVVAFGARVRCRIFSEVHPFVARACTIRPQRSVCFTLT